MSSLEQAWETQIKNIQSKTGKSLDQLSALILGSGLSKHGELRDMLKRELGLGHGDANALVHYVLKSHGERAAKSTGASSNDVLDEIYAGAKAGLRPIHEKLMSAIDKFGKFEVAPKKGYVSLRRKKQFAMVGPATSSRVEVGLNVKNLDASERLLEQPAGSMCHYKVKLSHTDEVDKVLIGWVKQAFDGST